MATKKFVFGQKGIWHRSASEHRKAKDIPCVVLEDLGVLYIFTFDKKEKNLTGRTATIFHSDFTPTK